MSVFFFSINLMAIVGNSFALVSGTSMATPHIAGIAALIKQYNPSWTPSMISSAIATTATKYDNHGRVIMAEGFGIGSLYPSTPFEFGSGLVTPNCAIDPGMVFSSGNVFHKLNSKSFLNSFISLEKISNGVQC